MGGKTKQSQRTKNNVRPSSSGRSALLLDSVKYGSGVMSAAGTELPALFPTLQVPIVDPLLSPEMQMCIKKLNKKDPITKTKALQELSSVVGGSQPEEVEALLPSWARHYTLLSADTDRRVRELAQVCHGSIVGVCGRRVAPHLKALVPAWLRAQYDDHGPARTHAQSSLQKTFPDSKLPEVISFCKTEIMSHLVENLTGAGDTPFIRKTDSEEEQQAQSARVVASSLHGLQHLVRHLPAAHHAWLWDQLAQLLARPAFWKRASHADERVRAAWYGVLGGIISRFPAELAALCGQKALRMLLAARDTSPLAAHQLWDAVLLFMDHVQEWHQYLDKADLLSKRILELLESGGWGDARHLSDLLLPLLAHLPPHHLTHEFYQLFFNAILDGLDKKSILSSRSERGAWIASLEECVRYVSRQPLPFAGDTVRGVLRGWLRRALADRGPEPAARAHLLRQSGAALAALAAHWLRQEPAAADRYDRLLRDLWAELGAALCAHADASPADRLGDALDAHVLLLHALRSSFEQGPRRQHSITFAGDPPAAAPGPRGGAPCGPAGRERYERELLELAVVVGARHLQLAGSRPAARPALAGLLALAADFEGGALWAGLARALACDSPAQLYWRVLRPWLADTEHCRPLVLLVFALLHHLPEREQDDILDSFQQLPPAVVEWCVEASVCHPHRALAAGRRWLRGELVRATLCALAARLVERAAPADCDLLLRCLDLDDAGELVVSAECADGVVRAVGGALCSAGGSLEPCARLCARLAGTLPPAAAAYSGLVLQLVRLTVHHPRGGARLSADTWEECRAAWQDGLAALPAPHRQRLLRDAAHMLRHHLLPQESKLDLSQVEAALSVCPYLVCSSSDPDPADTLAFTRHMLAEPAPAPAGPAAAALQHMVVGGHMSCPLEEPPAADELTERAASRWLAGLSVRAVYLRAVLLHRPDHRPADTCCDRLLHLPDMANHLLRALHDHCVLDALYAALAHWAHYELIKEARERLEAVLSEVVAGCGAPTARRLLGLLAERAAADGYFWPFARRWFQLRVGDHTPTGERAPTATHEGNDAGSRPPTEDTSVVNVEDRPPSGDGQEGSSAGAGGTDSVESRREEPAHMEDIVTGNGYFHTLQANEYYGAAGGAGGRSLRSSYLVMARAVWAAHGAEPALLAAAAADFAAGQRACCADLIVNAYYTHNHLMLYDQEVWRAPWRQVACNAAVADYLSELVAARGWDLPAHHWDFATITLCNLLTAVHRARTHCRSTKVALLARAVLQLFVRVESFVSAVRAGSEARQPAAHVAHLPAEWEDIFAPDTHTNLLHLALALLESDEGDVSCGLVGVLAALARCVRRLEWRHVRGAGRAAEAAARAAPVLARPGALPYKYLAYELLLALLKPMVLDDAEALSAWSAAGGEGGEGGEDARPPLSLAVYEAPARALHDLVPTALQHVKLCEETCSLAAGSDALALALGWSLLADASQRHVRLARGDLRHHYIHTYREQKYVEPLLTSALRLLPAEVLELATRAPAGPPPAPHHVAMFTRMPELHAYAWCDGAAVSAAWCRVLYWCVAGAGAGDARGWRGAAHHRHAAALDNIVTKYITPWVVKEELTQLQQQAPDMEDTEVSIHWSAYSARAVLSVEERPIELSVQLARSHPLGLPALSTAGASTVAPNANWLVIFMGYQMGSVCAAVRLWAAAVCARVERATKCYICYCRLHYSSGKLPAAHCRTCTNRFHQPCLSKWFATSGKRTCPMCRSAF